MKRQRVLVAGLMLAGLVIVAILVLLPRLGRSAALTGYVEGEPLYLAAPMSGTVRTMAVARGQEVRAGQPLFVVDPQQQAGAVEQAQAELAAAEAQAADVRKGQRPSELAALDANIAAAQGKARDAEATLRRTTELVAAGVASRQQLDDARAGAQTAEASLAAARRQKETATLGARADEVRAADARVAQAKAGVAAAIARLGDLAPKAPEAAQVEDVFFQQGEWAPANQPILSLLPDSRIYLKFFVPEKSLAAYRVGQIVRFSCDGCASGLTAKISYISPRPEFTPPVIYSQESRERLVFLVRALPSARLNPGQPVDVEPRR
ncbi:HlyD family efflux transporter periplasmic adaptor subunit [Phenylobacterium sp.]|uniref:HlyD family secretion protein n=1 Tax=Phenylobacterium sp. TaxID=1871053 RepID=UPI00262DAC5B|nr:HlyD family efflux transporter periplasmic adaptor subunit [Phenylobacterium sp.]